LSVRLAAGLVIEKGSEVAVTNGPIFAVPLQRLGSAGHLLQQIQRVAVALFSFNGSTGDLAQEPAQLAVEVYQLLAG
ncbi:hypothetical protein, partial [Salmonella sp. SAL4444]|uniref:hypothetical protein n=1 Tax=Salmonella sp. SAL4444 TaxID=3159899 RepID=UPI0039783676